MNRRTYNRIALIPAIGMMPLVAVMGPAQAEATTRSMAHAAPAAAPVYKAAPKVTMAPIALAGYTCHKRWNYDTVTRYGPGMVNHFTHRWAIKVLGRFYVCKNSGHRTYSIATATRGSYNRNGTHMDCAWWSPRNPLREMRFNSHQYDRWGHQFNPPEFQVGCRSRTWNTRWQKHPHAKRMYWRDGKAPTVHTWYRAEFQIPGSFEPSGTLVFAMKQR